MLSEGWWFFVILLVVASIALRQVPLLAVAILMLLAYGAARLWSKHCLRAVEYRRSVSPKRAFIGETVDVRLEVTNRKLLPLPWLEIQDEFPLAVPLTHGRLLPSYNQKAGYLVTSSPFRWYERVTKHYQVCCQARGYYQFGPARLRSGDIFGLFTLDAEYQDTDYLIIYPQIFPLSKLGLPSKEPFGDMRIRRQIFEDPTRTIGVRQYEYGDSSRFIHWKATARTGHLQVKVFEPTTTHRWLVFLNLSTFQHFWEGIEPALLEEAISVAASLCNYAIEQGYQVGLYANSTGHHSNQLLKIPASQDPNQMANILEALARVVPYPSVGMEELLQAESGSLPWGATIALVTATANDALLATMVDLQAAGHKVALLQVGSRELPGDLQGIFVHQVSLDGDQPPASYQRPDRPASSPVAVRKHWQ